MTIRIAAALLLLALGMLQYRIWLSSGGMREVWRLEKAIDLQASENERLRERNTTLAAEVRDLKEGYIAIEERARTDLGMIKSNETFFQIVPPTAPDIPPAATPAPAQRTAQAATQ
jgi:cell division protein FtsB